MRDVAAGTMDEAGLRQKLRTVYDTYVTLNDRKLPPLKPFGGKVGTVPEFAS